jgi:hypothetical protein
MQLGSSLVTVFIGVLTGGVDTVATEQRRSRSLPLAAEDPWEQGSQGLRTTEADRRVVGVESRTAAAEEEQLGAARALHEGEVREARLSERLRASSKALMDANQELAQLPLLKHRLAEMHDQNAALRAQLQEVIGSRSWQVTGFLRKLTAVLKLQR